MTIQILTKENPSGEDYKNLKFSRATMPFEYVVVEKNFKEPQEGEGTFGKWINYSFKVSEINTIDENTGVLSNSKEEVDASMFATEKLDTLIRTIAEGVKFKISKEKIIGKKGEYFTFAVEVLDKTDGESAEVTAPELDEDLY